MGNNEQHQAESSKASKKRSKKQSLAALVAVRAHEEKTGGVKINESRDVEDTHTLYNLNTVRRSPRKHGEIPPPNSTEIILPPQIQPSHNSTPSSDPIPTNPLDPINSTNTESFVDECAQLEETRKKRGKTMMKSFSLTPSEKVEVEFNGVGQPIGVNSKHLSSYLGILAREMIPMTIVDWRKVNKTLKEDLWTCIQTRFKVDVVYKNFLFKMLGQRWKESKSRLVSAIKDASTCSDSSSKLAMLKPDNIKSVEEWNDFVKEKLSEQFESTSIKYKTLRAKNKIPHTMSRKGYARLADDMKKENPTSDISRDELWCKAHTKKNGEPPNSVVADCIARIKEHNSSVQSSQGTMSNMEDGVSAVFGREHSGRVRGLGFGVLPSQMGIHYSTSKKVGALENKVNSLEAQVQELTKFMRSTNEKQNLNAEDPVTPRANTPQSHRSSNNLQIPNQGRDDRQTPDPDALVRRKCKLLSWNKVVAEGTIASTDPNALVHFERLGPDAWKVWVDVAVDPGAFLWKPNSEMSTIKEAVGTTIAWPKDFISFD